MSHPIGAIIITDLKRILRSRVILGTTVAGIAVVALIAAVAAGRTGGDISDTFRSGAASLILVGGLVIALTLGATASFSGAISGTHGLFVASGVSRRDLALGVLVSRLVSLAAVLSIWLIALQIGSVAIGRGGDSPLAVHIAAAGETHALVLLMAAATSTVMGPTIAAFVGLVVHVTATAVVNLEAAADLGLLPTGARLIHIAYNTLPRAVSSPMIVALQNRDAGGPAAPQFEINQFPVALPASGIATVLWTIGWCALFGWFFVIGVRRRTLS